MVGNFCQRQRRTSSNGGRSSTANTLNYQATIDDPTVYTRPWTIASRLIRGQRGEGEEYWEDACHEGERSADAMIFEADAGDRPFQLAPLAAAS